EHEREALAEPLIEEEELPGDLLARRLRAVLLRHAVDVSHELEHREVGNRLPVRDAVRLLHRNAAGTAALDELPAEPALADARLGDDPDHLPVAVHGAGERRLERRHLVDAADEAREAARPGDVEPRLERADVLELVDPYGVARALDG